MLKYGRSTSSSGPCGFLGVGSTICRSRHLVSGSRVADERGFDQSELARPSPTASVRRRGRPRSVPTTRRRPPAVATGASPVHRCGCGSVRIGAVGPADRRCHHHGATTRRPHGCFRSGGGCSWLGRHALGGVRRAPGEREVRRLHNRSTEVLHGRLHQRTARERHAATGGGDPRKLARWIASSTGSNTRRCTSMRPGIRGSRTRSSSRSSSKDTDIISERRSTPAIRIRRSIRRR